MLEQQGEVVALDGDEAIVRTTRQTSCGSCSNNSCGTGTLSEVLANKSITLRVDNVLGVTPGEQVILGISERALIQGSLLIYLLPLLAMFLGAWFGELMAGQMQSDSTLFAPIGGFIALGLAFVWVRRQSARLEQNRQFRAALIRRLLSSGSLSEVHFT